MEGVLECVLDQMEPAKESWRADCDGIMDGSSLEGTCDGIVNGDCEGISDGLEGACDGIMEGDCTGDEH